MPVFRPIHVCSLAKHNVLESIQFVFAQKTGVNLIQINFILTGWIDAEPELNVPVQDKCPILE